jgi:hypothetical protein
MRAISAGIPFAVRHRVQPLPPHTTPGEHDEIMSIEHLATRIRAEFQEMPGLKLTLPQAQRLWGLAPDVCDRVVDVLIDRAVLQRCGNRLRLRD